MQQLRNIGLVRIPSRTAAFAFAHWNAFRLTGDQSHVAPFLTAARWFAGWCDGAIRHEFPLLGLDPGWLSALSQGQALSIFARAHQLTGDPMWQQAAHRSGRWLTLPMNDGGVLGHLPDGSAFFEEYPGTCHAHVLNGCLYAMLGLAEARGIGLQSRMIPMVADTIERHMLAFERDGWSLYQWCPAGTEVPNYNTPSYQWVHIALFERLSNMLGRPVFQMAANRLRAGLRSPSRRVNALVGKLRYRWHQGYRR